jgi:hypothetical protein
LNQEFIPLYIKPKKLKKKKNIKRQKMKNSKTTPVITVDRIGSNAGLNFGER